MFVCLFWLTATNNGKVHCSGESPNSDSPLSVEVLTDICESSFNQFTISVVLQSSISAKVLYHYLLLLQTTHFVFYFTVSDFVDGSDLYTLWQQEKRLDDTTVELYSAELAITLG